MKIPIPRKRYDPTLTRSPGTCTEDTRQRVQPAQCAKTGRVPVSCSTKVSQMFTLSLSTNTLLPTIITSHHFASQKSIHYLRTYVRWPYISRLSVMS